MKRALALRVLSAFALLALSTPALADSKLRLVVAGEAYAGAPEYELRAGDRVLAHGAVEGAIDTETEGRLDEATLKALAETLDFDIPVGTESVTFAFTNDSWSGPDTNFDRNLYVVSASLDGVDVPLSGMKWLHTTELRNDPPIVMGALSLKYSGDGAVIPLVPAVPEIDTVAAPGPGKPSGEIAPVPTQREGAAAALAPSTVELSSCAEPMKLVVGGFAISSAEIPADALVKLREAADNAKTGCSLRITGYSSRTGPPDWNRTLAQMRAEAIRAYLSGRAEFVATEIDVGGETADFGSEAANRAVLVEIVAP